jgi:hypothetical protein
MEKKCISCEEIKLLKDFHIQQKSKDGRNNKCASCVNSYNSIRNKVKGRKISDKSLRTLVIVHPSKNDYKMMYTAMEKMGYNLKEDIHLQFCKKYNLPYKLRQTKNKNKWTYKEVI